MNKLVFYLLCVLVFTIPLQNSITIEGVGTITRFLGPFVLFFGLFTVLLRGKIRKPLTFHLLVALFIFWATLSYFWSVRPSSTLSTTWSYVQLGVMVWLIWELTRKQGRSQALLQSYVIGTFVSSFNIITVFFQDMSMIRYTAPGFNLNDIALTLVLGIPMAWHLLDSSSGKRFWFNLLYIPFGAFAVFLTASRAGFIGLMIALLIIPLTLTQMKNIQGKISILKKAWLLVMIFLLIYGLGLYVPEVTWARTLTFAESIVERDMGSRYEIWEAGYYSFLDNPIIGVGARGFRFTVEPFLGRAPAAHNTFLDAAVDGGFIGFAIFLGIMISLLALVSRMPILEKKLWFIMVFALMTGYLSLSWLSAKPAWFIWAMITVYFASYPARNSVGKTG